MKTLLIQLIKGNTCYNHRLSSRSKSRLESHAGFVYLYTVSQKEGGEETLPQEASHF